MSAASEKVGNWGQRTPEVKAAGWREVFCANVRTLTFTLSLMGDDYRVLFFTYNRIIQDAALKTDFEKTGIDVKRPIRKLLQ